MIYNNGSYDIITTEYWHPIERRLGRPQNQRSSCENKWAKYKNRSNSTENQILIAIFTLLSYHGS